jgi:hypothetical protein
MSPACHLPVPEVRQFRNPLHKLLIWLPEGSLRTRREKPGLLVRASRHSTCPMRKPVQSRHA